MKKLIITGVTISLFLVLALSGCGGGPIIPNNNPTPSSITSSPTHTPTPASTVTPDTSSVLRIVNNSKYYMVDIRLNGYEQISYPNVIDVGNYWDFTFTTGGTVTYYFGVGFYDSNTKYPDVWFELQGSTTVSAGNTTTITFDNPTIQRMLSNFSPSYAYWDGDYWYNLTLYQKTFKFYSTGAWQLYDNGTFVSSGSVILSSWPNYASIVSFKLSSAGPVINMPYPFGDFYYNNGPAGWTTIHYFKRL